MDLSGQGELVLKFVNTVDVEDGTDELGTPDGLAAWLTSVGLLAAPVGVTAGELALATTVRAGLREALGVSVGVEPDPEAVRAANDALRGLPLQVSIGLPGAGGRPLTGGPGLDPVRHALAAVAVAWAELVGTGENARLKRCPESTCGWCFWDGTKNRNRRWCSMRVCGNRAKTRAYAERRRPAVRP
ncbi:ABATE domain-containing protein [Streptomyces sp. ISL-11]|uniref:CGNR zinc finger domain-containing protein n=1 Tax=Streptomyces sp. ISL-11 TaxID=2819174 RepID=UPI001BE960C3|nr:CGNR zinc finger domain-containing protein [Streptomyces sp. ISL-11]MBT2383351.1 CGNR zinc finger domain-containing protein [Streptomyces sp. ISL-11]